MREAVSFGQPPCLFLVYGPGFQVPVSVSVYCVLSGTVFCSDVWGFDWSGCCALVDAVACICISCCGCARCIRLWSCHLYLFLHPVASASVSGLSGYTLTFIPCVQHYILSCVLLSLPSVWSGPVPAASSGPVPALYPDPVICSVLSVPVVCSGALYLTCSCSGCCSSWSCILVPVRCPVWSDPCLWTLTSGPCRLICNPMYSTYKPNTIGIR